MGGVCWWVGGWVQVCSLPWAKTDGNDEVDIVEGVLRNYARFSNVETDDTQRHHDDTDR